MPTSILPTRLSVAQSLRDAKQQVRENPTAAEPRIFLFQVLAVTGDWGRAKTQLEVCGDLDPATLAMVQSYREALACEALRAEVFAGDRTPLVLGEPQAWVAHLVEALRCEAKQEFIAAQRLRDAAFADAPTTAGQVTIASNNSTELNSETDDRSNSNADGNKFVAERFEWIADADTRLGPMLEVILSGKYYWVPWNRIQAVHIEAPHDLRDVVWMPAYFTWTNGGESAGLIPTRYPGSQLSDDESIVLARKTEWQSVGEAYHGRGQRMFATNEKEFSLMDVRSISLEHVAASNVDQGE